MPQRQLTGRAIKHNHSNALPRYIVAYDAETLPTPTDNFGRRHSHSFRLGVVKYCRLRGTEPTDIISQRIHSIGHFWSLVYSLLGPRHTVWIVTHNALFDMTVTGITDELQTARLLVDWPRTKRKSNDELKEQDRDSGTVIIDSPPTIIALRHAETMGRLVIVDTLNWFQCSLAEMGTIAGLPKLPMPSFDESDEAWFKYCERDTDIVFRTFVELVRWVKDNDMGMFRYTGPAQAFAAYRHRFMGRQILVHDNEEIKHLERKSYFGGRTEVFRLGELDQPVYQLDINSLFPSVMLEGWYPWKLDRFERQDRFSDRMPDIRWSDSIAEVNLSTPLPWFPVRTRAGVIYPVGRFMTTLAGAELQFARDSGYIVSVRNWAEYRTDDIFCHWVGSLWAMRQSYKADGNTLYADFCKKMMNSLYGKFGQLASEWVNEPDNLAGIPWSRWTSVDQQTGERTEYRSFGWTVQRKVPKKTIVERTYMEGDHPITEVEERYNEIPSSFPAISAFVTAAARMRMNYLRRIAGDRQVYYQGVDGLIVTQTGLDRLQHAGKVQESILGKLRIQGRHETGMIYGCSDYVLGSKVVIAGRARPAFDPATGAVMQRKFAGANMLFCGKAIDSIDESLHPWVRKGGYTKGTEQPGGWVAALELDSLNHQLMLT